jgi:uncharacterized cupin superfamily protein
MAEEAGARQRRWLVARVEDVPALPPTDDPGFWAPWTSDSAFNRGWHSVGRHLGVGAFGVNAKEAEAGRELVARHTEEEFGGQEELYVLVRGRARFTCDGETVDVGPGDVLFAGPAVVREAVALETPTLLVMIGGTPEMPYAAPEWNAS